MNPAPSKTDIYIFSLAASDGKEGYVRPFLDKYPDAANLKNQFGGTALTYAAGRNQIETVELLLEKGALIDLPDNNGWTPLMCAASKGHRETVLRLLEKGAAIGLLNNDGKTAGMLAREYGYPETAALIGQQAEARARAAADAALGKLKTRRPPQPPFKKEPKPR